MMGAGAMLIDAALSWLDRGFAVFPLEPRGKVPLGSLVPRGFLDASKDHAVICDWWRRAPKANIGIVTGGVASSSTSTTPMQSHGSQTLAGGMRSRPSCKR